MSQEKKYALITGGSHGIGRAMAEECLRRGLGVAIAALPDDTSQNEGRFIQC